MYFCIQKSIFGWPRTCWSEINALITEAGKLFHISIILTEKEYFLKSYLHIQLTAFRLRGRKKKTVIWMDNGMNWVQMKTCEDWSRSIRLRQPQLPQQLKHQPTSPSSQPHHLVMTTTMLTWKPMQVSQVWAANQASLRGHVTTWHAGLPTTVCSASITGNYRGRFFLGFS